MLRANEIHVYQSVSYVAPVRGWLEDLAASFITICTSDLDWNAADISDPLYAFIDLKFMWSRVIREAVRMRHGGALVVVPDVKTSPIDLKYRLQPFDLGGELRQTWLSLGRVLRRLDTKGDQVVDALETKRQQTHKLCAASRTVGHLTATDGCVVLDRKLTVHAFGGSINKVEQDLPPKRCVHVTGKEEHESDEAKLLQPFGERHKSAYNLCKQLPNTLAFVISQDGDLRLFASDETTVYLYDLLHP
jgi:hypothetical protein